jgi:acyl carrier protein
MITIDDIQKYLNTKLYKDLTISNNTRIIDLGFDSLELLELISYIENFCFVNIKLSEIKVQMSMIEFIEFINNKTDKPGP